MTIIINDNRPRLATAIPKSKKSAPNKKAWDGGEARAVQDSRSGETLPRSVSERMLGCDGIHCQSHHLNYIIRI